MMCPNCTLAGVAYATTGPGAVVAFALNGTIAFPTVLSFAEMSTAFPESGGTYTFDRKVLAVSCGYNEMGKPWTMLSKKG